MKINIPPPGAAVILLLTIVGIGWYEERALYKLDHPPPHYTDCLSCHSDAEMVAKMRDKAGHDSSAVYRAYHAKSHTHADGKWAPSSQPK